jgi:DNA-binding NtrC family response regulator
MSRTILIVDDEADLAATCARLLQRLGWHVNMAATRDAGLAVLATARPPALAIVDRKLPDGDGLDVLRAALGAGTPVVIMTGYEAASTRRLALAAGAAGFLGKPFSAQSLLDLANSIVGDPGGSRSIARPPARPHAADQARCGPTL